MSSVQNEGRKAKIMKHLSVLAVFYVLFFIAVAFGYGVTNYAPVVSDSPQVAGVQTTKSVVAVRSDEAALIDAINELRVQNDLAPLLTDKDLFNTANTRALDMVNRQYFSHTAQDGTSYVDLLVNSRKFSCENLNLTFSEDPKTIVDDWIKSGSGHRECLLDDKLQYLGISMHVFSNISAAENEDSVSYVVVFIGAS